LDLPHWFIDDLKSIDKNFVFVFHRWQLLWDDVMNQYTGSLEDPRFAIEEFGGEECWGWVLRDEDGDPKPDGTWHIWRLAPDYGYSHVINIASTEPEHLLKVRAAIWEQAIMRNMGHRRYMEWKKEQAEEEERKRVELVTDKFEFLEKENRKLTKEAMENFEFGRTAPTRPTKDIITSYPGQKNRSRIIRPLDDEDVGLVTWEDLD
jgi:hypothetical protein